MPGNVLRYLRRSSAGGAVEYAAQFLDGLIHPGLLRSGATPEEERRCLPGDELVPGPIWEATRAVTIDVAAADVWRWVAQMGYGRGGWYGWNPLERADTGVSQLLADLPPPKVGDVWLDGPGCDETRGAWKVVAIEPPQTLVLRTVRDPVTGRELDPAGKPHLNRTMTAAVTDVPVRHGLNGRRGCVQRRNPDRSQATRRELLRDRRTAGGPVLP